MTPQSAVPVVGVFSEPDQATAALSDLRCHGFGTDQVAVTSNEAKSGSQPIWEAGAGIGMMTGAAMGGFAGGPLGLLAGAVVGGMVGGLIDLGVSKKDAQFYQEEAESGGTLVVVTARARNTEAQEILRRHGAREAPVVS